MLREGDIDALRRKAQLQGKPIKSTLIRDGKREYFYRVDDEGNSRIDAVQRDRSKKVEKPEYELGKGKGKVDIGERVEHAMEKRMSGRKRKYFHS